MNSNRFYLWSEEEARQKIVNSRAELEELQDTGEGLKRWIKRYASGRPQLAT